MPKAPVATKASLIRIYETLASHDLQDFVVDIVGASAEYGRITACQMRGEALDTAFRQLNRAQGAPSYMLLLWLMRRRRADLYQEAQLIQVVSHLVDFFVRRNLTGHPQTYALPKLFMDDDRGAATGETSGDDVIARARRALNAASSSGRDVPGAPARADLRGELRRRSLRSRHLGRRRHDQRDRGRTYGGARRATTSGPSSTSCRRARTCRRMEGDARWR